MLVGLVYDSQNDYFPNDNDPFDENAEYSYDYEIENLSDAIQGLGHQVVPIGDLERLVAFLQANRTVDLIFNYAVGKRGSTREAQVPALLEGLRIPYTGADAFSLSVGNDKALCKTIWQNAGLPTGDFLLVSDIDDVDKNLAKLPDFPIFIKPTREGSSKGLCMVSDIKELYQETDRILTDYRQQVIIEPFLPGREFTVGVVGSRKNARALGVIELLSDNKPYRDYEEKKRRKAASNTFIAVESAELENQLLELGLLAYQTVDCQVIGRVDIRLDRQGQPVLMEINANPALKSQESAMPAAANAAGISYCELLAMLIDMAVERWTLPVSKDISL